MPDVSLIAPNPFTALTFITAPAILTNAASVLAMSTSNRFLRVTERMHWISNVLEKGDAGPDYENLLVRRVGRLQKQGLWLLSALRCAYVALGAFAFASLVSLIGAAIGSHVFLHEVAEWTLLSALFAGVVAVISLVRGCVCLLRATNLSMQNVEEEATLILTRQAARSTPSTS